MMENRFGVSAKDAQNFVKNMTTARKNGELIRASLQYVLPTPEQHRQIEAFCWHLLSNKEILQRLNTVTYLRPISAHYEAFFEKLFDKKVFHEWIEVTFASAFWRYATSVVRINVKSSTPKAKKVCVMALVHRQILYVALQKLIAPGGEEISLNSTEFKEELAKVSTDHQMGQLVEKIGQRFRIVPEDSDKSIPKLEDMEFEMVHLANFYKNRCRMAFQAKSVKHMFNFLLNVKDDPEAYKFMYDFVASITYAVCQAPVLSLQFFPILGELGSLSDKLNNLLKWNPKESFL